MKTYTAKINKCIFFNDLYVIKNLQIAYNEAQINEIEITPANCDKLFLDLEAFEVYFYGHKFRDLIIEFNCSNEQVLYNFIKPYTL